MVCLVYLSMFLCKLFLWTHRGRMMRLCIVKPIRCWFIKCFFSSSAPSHFLTNAAKLLIGQLWTNLNEICVNKQMFPHKKINLKTSSAKWRPFCLSLNMLISLYLWHEQISFLRNQCILSVSPREPHALVWVRAESKLARTFSAPTSSKSVACSGYLSVYASEGAVLVTPFRYNEYCYNIIDAYVWGLSSRVTSSHNTYHHLGIHDDVIKWKHFPRYWLFVWGIHRSPVNSPHKGQWRGALMFSLICVWINGWVNNREAGDLRRYRGHYDVTVMAFESF